MILIGCQDGSIIFQNIDLEKYKNMRAVIHAFDPIPVDATTVNLHGNCAVVDISVSFDSSMVYSSDADGGFFMSKNMHQKVSMSEPEQVITYVDVPIEDILLPTHYTLQENKIKSEKDREFQDAERKRAVSNSALLLICRPSA